MAMLIIVAQNDAHPLRENVGIVVLVLLYLNTCLYSEWGLSYVQEIVSLRLFFQYKVV